MQPKLITTFERLSEADFLAKAGTIVTGLTANSHFPEPWVAQVPTLEQLTIAYKTYEDCYHASLSHDNIKINLRHAARDALTTELKRLIPYLEIVAQGDVNVLLTTGYDLRKDLAYGSNIGILSAPEDFRVVQGTLSGSLDVHIAKLSGAGSYEVQIAQTDPANEVNWRHALSSINSSHILLGGLAIAQIYWVRVRGIGVAGSGAWTDPIMIVVN